MRGPRFFQEPISDFSGFELPNKKLPEEFCFTDRQSVYGRLEKALVAFNVKYSIILPQNCQFSQLVIRQHHVEMGYSGTSRTWASVREKFWIVKGGSVVRHVIGQCITTRKRNAKVGEQFMSILPSYTLQSFERPLYKNSIDHYGPFMIKQGRSLVKRYEYVFTCLTIEYV